MDRRHAMNLITALCVAPRGSLPDSHCLLYKQQRPLKMLKLYIHCVPKKEATKLLAITF